MSHISNYARNLIKTYALGSFFLGIALTLIIGYSISAPLLREEMQERKTTELTLNEEVLNLIGRNLSLESSIKEQDLLIKEWGKRYNLIASYLNSGYSIKTADDIRIILEEAENVPYGSPFKMGHKVTAQYGVYSIEELGWTGVNHPGIDLIPLDGDYTIYATADSTVANFGYSEIWGKYLTLRTEAGYEIFMAHLERIYWQENADGGWSLSVGDKILKGMRLGIAGQTGKYATGRHLHLEIRILSNGKYTLLDPEAIIAYTGKGELK